MCELYCPYLTPDDSSNLQFYDFDSMNNHLKTIGQNYFRKYSANYFYASQESGTLIFPNVIKGYNYNAKCVYQTTQSDNTKVKSQSYSLISENLHSDFPAKTVCNTFYIMNAIKKEIQELCKKNISKFSLPKEYEFRKKLPTTLVGKVAYKELEKENDSR